MKTIYKYNIETEITMPVGSEIIHVHVQNGVGCLWAIVDTNAPLSTRRFLVVGTGHPLPDNIQESYSYIGTFHQTGLHGENLVWHLFESTGVNLTHERYGSR